jgi:formylglycine-generating enzyme required for sulfatase activity
MGDDNGKSDDEKPQFVYHIRQPYALARFPVTNRQYLRFLDALAGRGGREEVAAAEEVRHLLRQHGLSPDQMRPRLRFWPGTRYRTGEGNCPVVAISWYAATAFAHWVDIWLHRIGVLHDGETVRLPTEAEWERAAAYPVVIPATDPRAGRREYPWGEWDEVPCLRANTHESGIGQLSVVGVFPHGAVACGAEDMAGNVWEWCSTPYLRYPLSGDVVAENLQKRTKDARYVLRGGSWISDRGGARCASRGGLNPVNVYADWGVRLARTFSLS